MRFNGLVWIDPDTVDKEMCLVQEDFIVALNGNPYLLITPCLLFDVAISLACVST